MILRKYKYYFRKPRTQIVKDILYCLLVTGALVIAAGSPYFIINILKNRKALKRYPKKKVTDTFYTLKKQGLIEIQMKNHQIYISLTEKGKAKASWLQIDALEIKRPKRWDGKWRILIFDISQLKKLHREALRGKLKELGFHLLQKSVWIYPFDCRAEIEVLRKFFGLSKEEIRLIVAEDIEGDSSIREHFKL